MPDFIDGSAQLSEAIVGAEMFGTHQGLTPILDALADMGLNWELTRCADMHHITLGPYCFRVTNSQHVTAPNIDLSSYADDWHTAALNAVTQLNRGRYEATIYRDGHTLP